MATTDMTDDLLFEHQVALLEELGFAKEDAERLAHARTTVLVKGVRGGGPRRYEQKVDHHHVKRLLNNGATREQVLAILL